MKFTETIVNTVLKNLPVPATGHVLNQTYNPVTTNWMAVTIAVSLVDSNSQVVIPLLNGIAFFQLMHP